MKMLSYGRLLAATVTLILLETIPYVHGIACISCQGASSFIDCLQNTVVCNSGEKCYLEISTTDRLTLQYNAGCRSAAICTVMSTLFGRKKRNSLLNCAECCYSNSGGPCNSMLCGKNPGNLYNLCYSCDGVSSITACTKKTICQKSQVCTNSIKVVGNLIRYSYGCEDRHLCEALYKNGFGAHSGIGKRTTGISICDACCVGADCNKEDCFTLRTHFNATDFATHSSG